MFCLDVTASDLLCFLISHGLLFLTSSVFPRHITLPSAPPTSRLLLASTPSIPPSFPNAPFPSTSFIQFAKRSGGGIRSHSYIGHDTSTAASRPPSLRLRRSTITLAPSAHSETRGSMARAAREPPLCTARDARRPVANVYQPRAPG